MGEQKDSKLLILGAGAFAEDIADIAQECGFEVVGFVENQNRQRCQDQLFEKPIFWVDEIADWVGRCSVICALGTTFRNRFVAQAETMRFTFATLIHPSARVSTRCRIATGSVISAGVIIAAGAQIGRHVLVNRGSLIGHHAQIGDFVSVGPGVNLGGNSRIAERVYLGMGSIIRNNCIVGKQSVVGAGAVVVKDVPERVQVTGVPARITKENIKGI